MDSETSAVVPAPGRSEQAPAEDLLQNWLVCFWKRLLDRTDFGIDDDFFALGGTRELSERMFGVIARACNDGLFVPEGAGALTIRRVAELVVARLEARTRTPGRPPSAPRLRPGGAQSILHDQLLSFWAELLGTAVASIDDDFFALGGTPELCDRMLRGVEHLCGQRIEAADLDRVLTIRSLGETLVARLPEAPVRQVQAGAPGVLPLFFLHGDFAGAGYYVHALARGLGPEQPFFALQLHGMHGEDLPQSLEEMAADHVRRVGDVWPDGPVHLGGNCSSAIIALEIAQQFARAGRDVASLLMIEPPVRLPQTMPRLPSPRLSPAARRLPRIREAWLLTQYREIVAKYRLPVYRNRTVVFWARDAGPGMQTYDRPETRAAMQRIAPRAEMHTCPGTHTTILGRHLPSLAAAMKAAMAGGDP